jgi:hypothetical protein
MPALQQMQQLAGQFAPKPQASPDVTAQIQGRLQEKQLQLAYDKEAAGLAAQLRQAELVQEQQLEAADRASNRQLAELATTVQLIRDQQKHASDAMMAQFTAQQEKQTMVLQAMLSSAAGAQQMSGAGSVVLPNLSPLFNNLTSVLGDTLTSAVSGISEQQQQFIENTSREAEVNRMALQALQSGLSALAQATLAPREGEIIRVPGQPVRVRSIIKQ